MSKIGCSFLVIFSVLLIGTPLQAKQQPTHSKNINLNREKVHLNTTPKQFNCKEKDSTYVKCSQLTAVKIPANYKTKSKQPLSLKVLNQFQFAKSRHLYRQDNIPHYQTDSIPLGKRKE